MEKNANDMYEILMSTYIWLLTSLLKIVQNYGKGSEKTQKFANNSNENKTISTLFHNGGGVESTP